MLKQPKEAQEFLCCFSLMVIISLQHEHRHLSSQELDGNLLWRFRITSAQIPAIYLNFIYSGNLILHLILTLPERKNFVSIFFSSFTKHQAGLNCSIFTCTDFNPNIVGASSWEPESLSWLCHSL